MFEATEKAFAKLKAALYAARNSKKTPEQIEKAKELYDSMNPADRSILEYIFPEVVESEDERIRETLLELVSNDKANGYTAFYEKMGITCDDAIAYLEKQKEQKSVEKEITLTSFEGTLNTFLFDFANSPIEDCEPKEYIKKHSAEILKAAYKELNAKLQQDIFEARQEGVRDGYEVAKAEQKPTEWSEEDKMNLNGCICSLHQYGYMTYADFLKHLPERFNLQPKQEWSEDDLKWAEEIRLALLYYSNDKPFIEELTNWFNNHIQPNPQWKPSEEQMEALKYALGEGGTFDKNALKSLFDDLKKYNYE